MIIWVVLYAYLFNESSKLAYDYDILNVHESSKACIITFILEKTKDRPYIEGLEKGDVVQVGDVIG